MVWHESSSPPVRIIPAFRAGRFVVCGCEICADYVIDVRVVAATPDSVLVVCEFGDADFMIELEPGMKPIFCYSLPDGFS